MFLKHLSPKSMPAPRWLARFAREDRGNATIESLMWMPIFLAAFVLVVDVSMIFNGQTMVLRTVQDANRNMSIGRLRTTEEVTAFIESGVAGFAPNARAESAIVSGAVISRVSVPASDLVATNWFNAFTNLDVTVQSEHLIEY
ncbi:Flp pilus assembly protein TadG [Rhodovulum iodosum]|uniref:Flp pilus assembly protein TadG n=1 Tax=Rhodovulum iodosum TaxID=68291 RepID=A0ABV3XNG9_9RHOB|nr:TadE/TadG family type IV pilus assembly protein [Rhodovulum robiginosum]RSK34773.1 hypothetical protein EJA01_07390 [Rhodovulum robiginosum]